MMQDKYADTFDTINTKLLYTSESIPSIELQDSFEDAFVGCNCTECCSNCPCGNRSGAIYLNGHLEMKDSNKPIYECNNNCNCDNSCTFKLVSHGPYDNLVIKQTADTGFGLFTQTPLHKGVFICEYAGELITEKEAEKRHKYYKGVGMKENYIFWIQEHFGNNTTTTVIDPTSIGNIGRFINHSCNANCNLLPVYVSNIYPKLCVFTNRDIVVGEEITFDYGSTEVGLIMGESDRTVCQCKSVNCKKYLPCHVIN